MFCIRILVYEKTGFWHPRFESSKKNLNLGKIGATIIPWDISYV